MGLQHRLDDPAAVAARTASMDHYREMDRLLADREFLAGPYSFADIAFYMAQFFADRMSVPIDAQTPRLQQWRDRITERKAVRAVIGPMAAYLVAQGRPLPAYVSSRRQTSPVTD
jgi:glutathione S-transferase